MRDFLKACHDYAEVIVVGWLMILASVVILGMLLDLIL